MWEEMTGPLKPYTAGAEAGAASYFPLGTYMGEKPGENVYQCYVRVSHQQRAQ